MTEGCAAPSLHWLPEPDDFGSALAQARERDDDPATRFVRLRDAANHRLDFLQTRRLDQVLTDLMPELPSGVPRLRVALAGGTTVDHLVPSIRVAALRRGLTVDVTVTPFGQWRQQVLDPASELYACTPQCVLLAPDTASLLPRLPLASSSKEVSEAVEASIAELTALWRMVRDRTGATVIQEVPWLREPPLYGHFERLVPAAPGAIAERLDRRMAEAAADEGTLILDLRQAVAAIGTDRVSDRMLWHHAKQAISPAAAPWAGDQIGRILAAVRGLSKKVVVLDLDNTLWGGVIGDDGMEGIVIGQGSGAGEAYAAFQHYLKRLAERGIVLAISSKNDRGTAEAPFRDHPEMVLRLDDFAAFEADWNDKPSAVQRIARELELGLDSFVFVDDNPAERDLMRRTLPEVAVPELPEAPELFAACLGSAGYFEAVSFTAEDTQRNAQYVANRARRELQGAAVDMESFLRNLSMTLTVGPFRETDVPRITQLINKTNQFNLTTRRYTEAEVRALIQDPQALTFAARLTDRFGDNGLTSVVICRRVQDESGPAFEIDTWLMSCRILGRKVEHAMLAIVAKEATNAGVAALIGNYIPTPKNTMVKDLYSKLGFEPRDTDESTGGSTWILPLGTVTVPAPDHLQLILA